MASTRRQAIAQAVLLLWFIVLGASPVAAQAPDRIRVQLLWHHQAQFAGFYVAQAKGYYERAGIVVELIEGGPGINTLDEMAQDRADVALSWLPQAIAARQRNQDAVNIAQIFRKSGTAIVCRRDMGFRNPADIAGKTIGVWNVGDELNVRSWLRRLDVAPDRVTMQEQRPDGRDLIEGRVPCATAMMYNEYWSILRAGISPGDLLFTRLSDNGLGFLEDGLYVRAQSLADNARRDALARFLRATLDGWSYALDNIEEAYAISMAVTPQLDVAHQRRMLETILHLTGGKENIGLLDLDSYERSADVIAAGEEAGTSIRRAAQEGWTHQIWRQAGFGDSAIMSLSVATRHYLNRAVSAPWFYALDLLGTAAFAIAGFMRAQRRRYDLWGAFILALLPAVGGGTLRDLLVGGDRHPPFIFNDPTYVYIVVSVVIAGTLLSRFTPETVIDSRSFERVLALFDTVGMATFAVLGAKVALLAGLNWVWIPFCAALTCSGGGMLLDIVTGREPRTFKGEPYEEIAVVGGMFLFGVLLFADGFEHSPWIVTAAIVAAIALVFSIRMLVIVYRLRSYRLGQGRIVRSLSKVVGRRRKAQA